MKRTTTTRSILSLLASAAMLASCSDTPTQVDPPGIIVPTAYTFNSRFTTGATSVDYNGQIVRNLLIQDLMTTIRNLAKPGAVAVTVDDLLRFYQPDDAWAMKSVTTAGTMPVVETEYQKIAAGKKLADKISPAVVIGSGKTADALVREWLQTIADNSNDPTKLGTPAVYIDAMGRDLSEMVTVILLGSVSYHQATGVYLQNTLTANNAVAVAGTTGSEPFTEMEHNWDEAFGYFGAARDMGRYTDDQLAGAVAGYVFDSNGDSRIDLTTEYNYSFARYAAKRDKVATGVDFTGDMFKAFLNGRATITGLGASDAISAQRAIIASTWEKIVAANAIHYLNSVITDMGTLTADSNPTNSNALSGHWGEMKAYTMALQYNPFRKITDDQLTSIHSLMGDAPVFVPAGIIISTDYIAKLKIVRETLRTTLGFTAENAAAF